MKKILLTGASGRIGRVFFEATRNKYQFHLVDRDPPAYEPGGNHTFKQADLTNKGALDEFVQGIDTVVHLAGIPDADAGFEDILPNNILATTYVFEAAHAAGCRRVVFASSAQTIEGYPVDRQIGGGMAVRPANFYGVSKCYGEAIGAFYAARKGLSTIAVRIGAFEFPDSHNLQTTRDLSAFLSPRDAAHLLERCVDVEDMEFFIAHGISNNRFKRLDLSETCKVLGYAPKDDAFAMFDIGIDTLDS